MADRCLLHFSLFWVVVLFAFNVFFKVILQKCHMTDGWFQRNVIFMPSVPLVCRCHKLPRFSSPTVPLLSLFNLLFLLSSCHLSPPTVVSCISSFPLSIFAWLLHFCRTAQLEAILFISICPYTKISTLQETTVAYITLYVHFCCSHEWRWRVMCASVCVSGPRGRRSTPSTQSFRCVNEDT